MNKCCPASGWSWATDKSSWKLFSWKPSSEDHFFLPRKRLREWLYDIRLFADFFTCSASIHQYTHLVTDNNDSLRFDSLVALIFHLCCNGYQVGDLCHHRIRWPASSSHIFPGLVGGLWGLLCDSRDAGKGDHFVSGRLRVASYHVLWSRRSGTGGHRCI